MKCPHCSTSFGFFSNEMKELGVSKTCPKCDKGITVGIIHTRFAMAFIPISGVGIILGLSGPLAAGVAGGVAALVSIGLKRA